MSPKGVSVSHRPDAIRICLDRPPVNALTVEMLGYITTVIADARADPRPVLITGSLRIFSAGFDVKHPAPDTSAVNAAARECITAVQQHPGLTVAAVEGAAVGLGLLIAASADILVVSRTAQLRMPEVALGIVSDVQPLRRFLPDPWIRRLCLLGEAFSAEQLHLESACCHGCMNSWDRSRPGRRCHRGIERSRRDRAPAGQAAPVRVSGSPWSDRYFNVNVDKSQEWA